MTQAPAPGPLSEAQIQSVMLAAMKEVRPSITDHVEAACMDADISRLEREAVDMGETGWAVMRATAQRFADLLAPTAPVEDVSTKSPETNTSAERVKESAENEHVAAPVEASGSERAVPICHEIPLSNHMKVTLEYDPDGSRTAVLWNEANEPIADGDASDLAALRSQPSGETREVDDLINDEWSALVGDGPDAFANPASVCHDEFRTAIRGVLSALRPAPVALGGQHSSATDFPPDDVLACVPVAETAGEAVDYDLPITDYTPSVSGLSDYLWNQEQAAESIEDRCIFEQWREAIDALKATKLVAINPEQWTPCSPEWLDVHPRGCSEAPRVAAETWDGHSHYHPVNWPVPAQDDDKLRSALTDLVSWFDKPVQGERGVVWVIRAGDQGADDAVTESRAFLARNGKGEG